MSTSIKPVPSPAEFERLLVRFISETLLRGSATVDRDTRLFQDGYMNSLRILDLIAFVEKTLGKRVPDRSVRLASFRTIATIVAAFHPDASGVAASPNVSDRVFERRGDRSRFASPVDALVQRGDLRVIGPGQVELSGLALDLFRAVDWTVARWARELGAVEQHYPSAIAVETLDRAGRVPSGSPEGPVIPSGARDVRSPVIPSGAPEARSRGIETPPVERPRGSESLDSSTPAAAPPPLGMTAAPAVCYHAYPRWEGKTIGPNPVLLTAVGRCHRDEGEYTPLDRLSDFTMREIVILGTRDQVESQRQALVRQIGDLVTQLELDSVIEPASDPFFTSADDGRRLMQQLGSLKLELRLAVDPNGRTTAAASFNHHHDYFGTRFTFHLADGTPAHSGCVAFGLERWVLALTAQHGVDERAWPTALRDWLNEARTSEVSA